MGFELKLVQLIWPVKQRQDSPHSWFNLILIGLYLVLSADPRIFYGSLFVSIMDNFDMTREEATRTFNYFVIPNSLAGVFVGFFSMKLGTKRSLYLACLFGVLASFSVSMIPISKDNLHFIYTAFGIYGFFMGLPFSMMVQISSGHFSRHRSKAMTITCLFTGMCAITHPPFLLHVLKDFGLRGYWLFHSTMLLQGIVPLTLITVHKPTRTPNRLDGKTRKLNNEMEKELSLIEGHDLSLNEKDGSKACEPSKERNDLCVKEEIQSDLSVPVDVKVELLNRKLDLNIEYQSTHNLDNENLPSINFKSPKTNTDIIPQVRLRFLPTMISLFKNFNFYASLLCQVIGGGGHSVIMSTIVDYGMDDGLDFETASYLTTTYALGAAVGAIFAAWFLDTNYLNDKISMSVGMLFSGGFICLLSLSSGRLLIAATFGSGLLFGLTASTRVKLISTIGVETTGAVLGLGFFATSCLYLLTPAVIGLCRDHYGSYFYLYFPLSFLSLCMAFLYLVIYIRHKRPNVYQ